MAEDVSVSVTFDRNRPIYLPGETVCGNVTFDNPIALRGVKTLRIKIRGKTCVRITRVENTGPYGAGQVHTYRSKFYHIKEDHELLDVVRDYHGVLPASTFSFPFSVSIPAETPPTFTVSLHP
jgi:hypothetical protein